MYFTLCSNQLYPHYMIMIITNDYHVVFWLKQAYSISFKNDLDRGLHCKKLSFYSPSSLLLLLSSSHSL